MHKNIFTYMAEAYDRYRADRRAASTDESDSKQSRLRRILRWLMPNGGTLLLVIALIATAQVRARPLASPTGAPGPSATTVNYQGRLADDAGAPLDGTYGMSFALYDAATGGNLVWGPEEHTAVEVSDGLFSVGLGSKTSGGIPTTKWNGDRYLEITVGGETLEPRELIRSVPIAGMALTVPDGAIGSEKLAVQYWDIVDKDYWQTEISDDLSQYVSVPGIDFSFTPSVDGVVLLDLSTNFSHSTADTNGFCGISVNGDWPEARSVVFLDTPNRKMNCSTNLAYPVQSGQTYQFKLVVYANKAGTFEVHKGNFTHLSAVFFGSP